jgi:ABC-type sulfate transport system permease subunit
MASIIFGDVAHCDAACKHKLPIVGINFIDIIDYPFLVSPFIISLLLLYTHGIFLLVLALVSKYFGHAFAFPHTYFAWVLLNISMEPGMGDPS